jgi:hypothetical protein
MHGEDKILVTKCLKEKDLSRCQGAEGRQSIRK